MPATVSHRLARRALLGTGAALCLAPLHARPAPPLMFGVLPLGGALESRRHWEPLLAAVAKRTGRNVVSMSVTSYESLAGAIAAGQVDLCFLSGKMALDAVVDRRMTVIAQLVRTEGVPHHRAILLARKAPPHNSLEDMLARPEQWRLARGDRRSVSGFIVPQAELFLPHGIEMQTRFRGELLGTHQETALAVANGDADVATNNTTDLERFRRQFPVEAGRLQVIWESQATPRAQILIRPDAPAALQRQVQAAFVGYGRGTGPRAEAERAALRELHTELGYEPADNAVLKPVAQLEHELATRQARAARFVNEAAREKRLARIDEELARREAVLTRR